MERRKFLNLGLVAAAAVLTPMTDLFAVNFRETKPKAWAAEKSVDAIKADVWRQVTTGRKQIRSNLLHLN